MNNYTDAKGCKRIICLNNMQVVGNSGDAKRLFNLSSGSAVRDACRRVGSCGQDLEGNKLRWLFLEDYDYLINNNIPQNQWGEVIKNKYKK